MKKLFVVLGLLLIATMLFVGCGTGKTDNASTTQNQLSNQDYNKTGTLQGKIMDATNGNALGNDNNSELKIWLIQGTDNRGPSKLINDKNDPLCGEYAFSGIPVDGSGSGEIYFKVVVVKTGYQRFEAEVYLSASVFGTNDTYNNVINMMGDIYLFPLGTSAGDVSVYVYDPQGTPVPNATVLLRQNVNSNSATTYTNTGWRLGAYNALYSSLTTTTSAAGVATFSSANLVLGGSYSVVVEPKNIGGMQLARDTSGSFIVGTNDTTRVVNMATTNSVLFATSASNQVPGTITASGVLTITFNQPIILSTTGFNAAGLASDGTNTNFDFQAVLSADGRTMTLTPNSAITGTTADRAGSVVTFTSLATANQPFIIKSSQMNSGLTFNGGFPFPELQNVTTNSAVSNVVRQLSN